MEFPRATFRWTMLAKWGCRHFIKKTKLSKRTITLKTRITNRSTGAADGYVFCFSEATGRRADSATVIHQRSIQSDLYSNSAEVSGQPTSNCSSTVIWSGYIDQFNKKMTSDERFNNWSTNLIVAIRKDGVIAMRHRVSFLLAIRTA